MLRREDDGTRTRGHRDHNPELYQLSYVLRGRLRLVQVGLACVPETCKSSFTGDEEPDVRSRISPDGRATVMEGPTMERGVQHVLQRRLEDVDQEVADLRSLLAVMRRIERDAALRARLREVDLGFRLQDVWAGRITGDALRRALVALEDFAGPAPRRLA